MIAFEMRSILCKPKPIHILQTNSILVIILFVMHNVRFYLETLEPEFVSILNSTLKRIRLTFFGKIANGFGQKVFRFGS